MPTAHAVFRIESWEESPTGAFSASQKITRANVVKSYAGELEGEGIVEYVMAYVSEAEAFFVGVEFFTGWVGKRSGTFMMQHAGSYKAGVVMSTWDVVGGSGEGELIGLSGRAAFQAGHEVEYPISFEYELH